MKKIRVRKSYQNKEFLNSAIARPVRLLAELLDPQQKLSREGIKDTVVFFGSARIKDKQTCERNLKKLLSLQKKSNGDVRDLKKLIRDAKIDIQMSKYYEEAVELSKMITEWAHTLKEPLRLVVCSGGGPGIMEAVNKGAYLAGGRSLGLNISLPIDQKMNKYVTPELCFEFHYFFMRKYWFVYPAKAFIMFPGGFGTMDELMEILTLVQTKKLKKKVVILLYSSRFWKKIINFDELIRCRLISKEDLELFDFVDSPKQAFKVLVDKLTAYYPLHMNSNSYCYSSENPNYELE